MNLLKAFAVSISMYSRIPMVKVAWTKESLKYAVCFFPFVGLVTAVCEWALGTLLIERISGELLTSVVLTLIPVLINGGFHLDGYMDTLDALCSYGGREKKLEILKDPHAGAFAMIGLCTYLLLQVALFSQVTVEMLPVIGCGYMLSRALSGFSVAMFPTAKDSGLVKTFQDHAHRRRVALAMVLWGIAAAAGMLWLNPVMAVAALCAAAVVFLYYRVMSIRQFGGITGDLAGYFLQLCELFMLFGIVLAGGVLWK